MKTLRALLAVAALTWGGQSLTPLVAGNAVNGLYVWTDETSTEQARQALVNTCLDPAQPIGFLLLSDQSPYGYTDSQRVANVRAFNTLAHAAGLRVYALFTDKYWINHVPSYNAGCTDPSQKFDGCAMDFEGPWPSGKTEPYSAADIQYYAAAKAACGALPLHVSIGWHWDNSFSYGSQTKPAYQHILDIVDSVDVQTAFETAAQIVYRAKDEVHYASQINKPVFPTIETQDLSGFPEWGTGLHEWNTFFEEGETAMWSELAQVSFPSPDTFTGFILHYYQHVYSSGTTLWPAHPLVVPDTEPPTITAPPAKTVATDAGKCEAAIADLGTPVIADNCGVASVANDAPAEFPKGSTTVTWTVTDTSGNTATATQTVTVNDTEPPSIAPPADITLPNDPGVCGAKVTYPAPVGTDNCPGAATVQTAGLASGSTFPVGTTVNTFEVTDASGNKTACSFSVTVNDREVPVISAISASPGTLWPPNHNLVLVTVNYSVTDNCGVTSRSLSATSNEPDNGLGDGDQANDIQLIRGDSQHLYLRAERSGRGTGRIYTITVECKDASGSAATKTVTVTVPRDQGKK